VKGGVVVIAQCYLRKIILSSPEKFGDVFETKSWGKNMERLSTTAYCMTVMS